MKTMITLKQKSFSEQWIENIKDFGFRIFCFLQTVLNHPRQYGEVYWSISDCYIEIGKSGYISKNKMFDLNGDITPIAELIVDEKESLRLNLSEPELLKIKQLADEKKISVKDLLMNTIDELQTIE